MKRSFSIVIPTRDRLDYLLDTLKSVLDQNYENFEIVISDCSVKLDTKNYFQNKTISEKIKYFKANSNFTRSQNWEFGLSKVKNDYIIFVGDDDGLFSDSLNIINQLMEHYNTEIVNWKKIDYHWPDHLIPARQNTLSGTSYPICALVNSEKKLKLFKNFFERYSSLPCVYNSAVNINLINTVKQNSKNNIFFNGIIPDVYSGIVLSKVTDKYLQTFFPLSINGASRLSGGVLQAKRDIGTNSEFKNQILDLDIETLNKNYDPAIGKSTAVYSIELGEYLMAVKNTNFNFEKPNWRKYISALIREADTSENYNEIIDSINHTIKYKKLIFLKKFKKIKDEKFKKWSSPRFIDCNISFNQNYIKNPYDFSKSINFLPDINKIEKNINLFFIKEWLKFTKNILKNFLRIYFSK